MVQTHSDVFGLNPSHERTTSLLAVGAQQQFAPPYAKLILVHVAFYTCELLSNVALPVVLTTTICS